MKLPPMPEEVLCLRDGLVIPGVEMVSILYYPIPLAQIQHGLLFVVRSAPGVAANPYHSICPETGEFCTISIIEDHLLDELSYPVPDFASMSRTYWMQHHGQILWGKEPNIPDLKCSGRLVSYYIDWYASNRTKVLRLFIENKLSEAARYLLRQRELFMCTALLSRGIWYVFPETLLSEFSRVFSDSLVVENGIAVQLNREKLKTEKDQTYDSVVELLWLFERLLTTVEGVINHGDR